MQLPITCSLGLSLVHMGGDHPAKHTSVWPVRGPKGDKREVAAEVACRPASRVLMGSCGHGVVQEGAGRPPVPPHLFRPGTGAARPSCGNVRYSSIPNAPAFLSTWAGLGPAEAKVNRDEKTCWRDHGKAEGKGLPAALEAWLKGRQRTGGLGLPAEPGGVKSHSLRVPSKAESRNGSLWRCPSPPPQAKCRISPSDSALYFGVWENSISLVLGE